MRGTEVSTVQWVGDGGVRVIVQRGEVGQSWERVQLPDRLMNEAVPRVCWSWPGGFVVPFMMAADCRSAVKGGWPYG